MHVVWWTTLGVLESCQAYQSRPPYAIASLDAFPLEGPSEAMARSCIKTILRMEHGEFWASDPTVPVHE